MMPFYDFECQKCKEVKEINTPWSKDMESKLDDCECGANEWKRLFTVGHSKAPDMDKEVREAHDLIGHSWR